MLKIWGYIENLNNEDESICSIYSHMLASTLAINNKLLDSRINVYHKRKAAITSKSGIELNSLVKIWSEIFEILLPCNDDIPCKWYIFILFACYISL